MDEELIANTEIEKTESSYFTELNEDNSNDNFSHEMGYDPIESSSSNKWVPFLIFNQGNIDYENPKRELLNQQNFVIPKLFLESSYFENDKKSLIDIIKGFEKQSFFISTYLHTLGNYSWISKDVIRRLIGTKFLIKDEEEVLEFLINHQDHCSKILEFQELIVDYVKAPKLELEYLIDPEEGCEAINMVVKTKLSPAQAIEIEDQIFSDYFEKIFTDKHFKLNFRVESNNGL